MYVQKKWREGGRMLICNVIKVKSESTIVDIQTDYLQKVHPVEIT